MKGEETRGGHSILGGMQKENKGRRKINVFERNNRKTTHALGTVDRVTQFRVVDTTEYEQWTESHGANHLRFEYDD